MSMPTYPLEEVIDVKKRRVDEAERVVIKKQEALKKEEEELIRVKEEREKVRNHQQDKLAQLKQVLDEGTTSHEIQMMKNYLEVVAEKLEVENKKVEEQKDKVEVAKKELDHAKEDLRDKRQQVDKLKTHRLEWLAEAKREFELEEAKEQDEIGSILYMKRKKQGF